MAPGRRMMGKILCGGQSIIVMPNLAGRLTAPVLSSLVKGYDDSLSLRIHMAHSEK